jgi:hypothetical protein
MHNCTTFLESARGQPDERSPALAFLLMIRIRKGHQMTTTKTVILRLRVTPEQARQLKTLAAADGRPAANWLRWQITSAYDRLSQNTSALAGARGARNE